MSSVKPMQLAILLATTGLLHDYTVKGTQKGTACSVASKGRSGSITCHFSENLNVTKQGFSVRRSRLDGRGTEWVVDCTWLPSDRFKCFINSSYTFNEEVSHVAVIHIPELREEHETRYWCQVIPSEYSFVETCSFKSPGKIAGTQQPTENLQGVPISDNDAAQGETSSLSPDAIAGIVVGVILCLAAAVAVITLVIILKKRVQKKPKKTSEKRPTTGEQGEEQLRPCIYKVSNIKV